MAKSRNEFEKIFPEEYIRAADDEGYSDVIDNAPPWFIEHLRDLDSDIGVGKEDFLASIKNYIDPLPEDDDEFDDENIDDEGEIGALYNDLKELDKSWEEKNKIINIKI